MNRLDFEVLRLDFGRIRDRIWRKTLGEREAYPTNRSWEFHQIYN